MKDRAGRRLPAPDRRALSLENRRPHSHQDHFYGGGSWEFNLIGIYHGTRRKTMKRSSGFNGIISRKRCQQNDKGTVGWYIVKVDNPDDSLRVPKAIDAEFANSPYETKTAGRMAFAANWVKQFGNIQFLIMSIGGVVFFTLLLVTGNTMAISVRERTAELAVFKAMGYSDPLYSVLCAR